jgi:DNA-binding MarR family transcriptional regulator
MPTKQTLWQLVANSPFLQIAAIVTILVGLFSIIKDIGKLTMGTWHQLERLYHWYGDKALFHYMKAMNKAAVYEVKELAEALHERPKKIAASLRRLEEKHKVRRMNADEVPSGLWCLDEFED